jgi:hypothetical protein
MDASRSLRGALAPRRKLYRRAIFAAATGSVSCVAALIACGGTTGREGLSTPDAGDDATVDVGIQYIDRPLPDLYVAPIDTGGGGEAGVWPGCAPDLPVYVPEKNVPTPHGVQVEVEYDAGFIINADGSLPDGLWAPFEVPAVWVDGGGEVPVPDGSACGTQVWFGSAACDECIKEQCGGTLGNDPWYGAYGAAAMLPPCSDMEEAGVAVAGPMATRSRLTLCQTAFNCIVSSQCYASGTDGCYCDSGCTTAGPNGVCGPQIQAALEVQGSTPAETTQKVANLFGQIVPPNVAGHGGASLGVIVSCINSNCVPSCTGDAGSH